MKKWIICLCTAVMLLTCGTAAVSAENQSEEPVVREPGYCGENVKWSYSEGTLTLEGEGPTDDFYAGQPWMAHQGEIKKLVLKGAVSYIGAYAFPEYRALEEIDFGTALTEIGQGAFSYCDGLTTVSLPGGFRVFGEESFSHCKNLKEIHFAGGMPKFKLNCLWDTYAKLIYPAARPWPLQHIQQLEEAFQGRIEFLDSDGVDPYVPEAETETEAPEETEAPTTEETTQAAETTVETTVETEAQATEEETTPLPAETKAPETQVSETTEEYVVLPEPEDVGPAEEKGISLKLAGLIALMVVSGGAALFLLGNMGHNRKKDFVGDFSEILLEDERKKPAKKQPAARPKAKNNTRSKKGGKYSR